MSENDGFMEERENTEQTVDTESTETEQPAEQQDQSSDNLKEASEDYGPMTPEEKKMAVITILIMILILAIVIGAVRNALQKGTHTPTSVIEDSKDGTYFEEILNR